MVRSGSKKFPKRGGKGDARGLVKRRPLRFKAICRRSVHLALKSPAKGLPGRFKAM